MGRGGILFLSYAALVLSRASVVYADADFWAINIDEGAAPAPEDGPAFSAHAIRDPTYLPVEIVAVVASYVGSIFIIGTLILTVGRRLRKQAQLMALKPTEMVRPTNGNFDPSPLSPNSQRGWYVLRNKKSATSSVRSGSSKHLSPKAGSVLSFDQTVIDADRDKRQKEMERLYSAVMEQDDLKSTNSAVDVGEVTTTTQAGTGAPHASRRNPPKLVTTDPRMQQFRSGQDPHSPRSPARAIYPPDVDMPIMPSSPTSPVKAEYPLGPLSQKKANQSVGEEQPGDRASRAGSVGSGKSTGSGQSSPGSRKLRKSIRNFKISPPMHGDDNSDGARTPLSPRCYTDPGVPPEPPVLVREAPLSPQTPATTTSSHYYAEDEEVDEVRDLPLPHPHRRSGYNFDEDSRAATDLISSRNEPNRAGLTVNGSKPSAGSVNNNTLPFRQMNEQQRRQQPSVAHPLSPGVWNHRIPASAGPTKTTFLEARQDRLRGPVTGLPTPYSPYMPFTPLTPVTPHITTKAERKQRQKEEKARKGVITEEDQVVDEKALWSSGY